MFDLNLIKLDKCKLDKVQTFKLNISLYLLKIGIYKNNV